MELFTNASTTTLNGNINNSTTTVLVNDASTFPSTGNFRIIIGTELMKVTARSSNTLTVLRAIESTTAASHNSGDLVTVILTADALANFRSDSISLDTVANRPIDSSQGRLYLSSDGNGPLAVDSGSTWQPFGLYNFPLTAPSTGNFGTKLGTATDSFTQNGDSFFHSLAASASTQTVARVKTLTLDKTYTAQLTPVINPISTVLSLAMVGLIIRDSSTGNTRGFGFYTTSGTRSFLVTNLTYTSGNFVLLSAALKTMSPGQVPAIPTFFRINQPSSGNRIFSMSIDNQNWVTFFSEAWNNVVANPDQIGFLIYANGTYNSSIGQLVRHYKEA